MNQNLKLILVGTFLFFAGVYAGFWTAGQIHIDACLDAGGAWQTAGSYCAGIPVVEPQ